ncbi:beta-glucosidase BglX [Caulobacter sp. Root342]|uniref:beta-glucosidase BglX n=1 Tax=Caulobacter sp. Root342 TaxID=1736519 RepID=UPI0009EA8375|nr:beta-glucosidase BglX [Caulobacter sp. Root342]
MKVGFVAAALACGLASAGPSLASEASKPSVTPHQTVVSDKAIKARVEALLAQMTPEEKAGQLFIAFHLSPPPKLEPFVEKGIAEGRIGNVLFVSDPAHANALQRVALEQSRLKIPLMFGFDVIHGLRTIFPVPIGLAASWDPKMVEDVQASAAGEARAVGIQWSFAPNVDIARDPRWGRMVEGAGEDPYLGSVMAAAQVRGFQGPAMGTPNRIIAGVKHFAAYGAALGGRDYDEVNVSDSELWNVYLPPFKAAIDAGAYNVMSAYMPLNGVPATANSWLLTDVLRDTWRFKGFVVSDAGAVGNLVTHGLATDRADAAVRALNAGVTMEMDNNINVFSELPKALAQGAISQVQLDDAVRKVLETKVRLGLFENPYADVRKAAEAIADPERRRLARVAAERSAVLLRNEGAVLPLDHKTLRSVAVIGPLADSARDTEGPWVFKPQADGVTILAGLREKLGPTVRIDHVVGVGMPRRLNGSFIDPEPKAVTPPIDDTAGIAQAVAAARNADVAILVLGEKREMIGENASRASLDLPGKQQDLLEAVVATGKPVVLVLMSGRPLDLKSANPAAILEAWYPGSEGGRAVANLLMGDTVPGGKLPFSWPRNVGQVPLVYSRLSSHAPYQASLRYWDQRGAPVWPFGFGLSYTRFDYEAPSVERTTIAKGERVGVSVTVRNVGTRVGDETVQLYVHQRSGAARPVRELKGFRRVTLQPGETKVVRFELGPDELSYWSSEARAFVQDASAFDVWLGGDSTASARSRFAVVDAAQDGGKPVAP